MSRLDISDQNTAIDFDSYLPISDHLIMEVMKSDRTESGIIIPGGDRKEICVGKVLRVGPGTENVVDGTIYPMDIRPDMIALTVDYMGDKAFIKDKEYRIVREHGIWATVTCGPEG